MINDPLGVTARLITDSGTASYVSLAKLAAKTGADVARLPHTIKILLENIARRAGACPKRMSWRLPGGRTAPLRPSHSCLREY